MFKIASTSEGQPNCARELALTCRRLPAACLTILLFQPARHFPLALSDLLRPKVSIPKFYNTEVCYEYDAFTPPSSGAQVVAVDVEDHTFLAVPNMMDQNFVAESEAA